VSLPNSIRNKLLGSSAQVRVRRRGTGGYSFEKIEALQTFTVTIASPGVVTKTAHGFVGGELLELTTSGSLPIGLVNNGQYYVIPVNANTFRLATSLANYEAGIAINTSGSQNGTHSYRKINKEKRYPDLPVDEFLKQLVEALNAVS
jgi:hypothetical protein